MIARFRIVPSIGPREAARRISSWADADASILRLERGALGRALVFCHSPLEVRAQAMRFERSKDVAAGLCALTLFADRPIAVEACGSASSSRRLARFVDRVLRELGPCQVFDEESDEELTAAVARSSFFLFATTLGDSAR